MSTTTTFVNLSFTGFGFLVVAILARARCGFLVANEIQRLHW